METGLIDAGDRKWSRDDLYTGDRALSFVDTNVLVYAFDKSNSPKKRVAQRLMNALVGRGPDRG